MNCSSVPTLFSLQHGLDLSCKHRECVLKWFLCGADRRKRKEEIKNNLIMKKKLGLISNRNKLCTCKHNYCTLAVKGL